MPKVKCVVCDNEDNSFCDIKKCKIKVNKPRTCDIFKFDPGKIKIRRAIPTVTMSAVDVIKDKPKKRRYTTTATNSQHPLTGDLSRFTTTASKGDR
jgi:hypothetical protein